MTSISIRLYGELNEFLPSGRQQQRIVLNYQQPESVLEVLAALHVPATEVDLITVNGESVDFSCIVEAGDSLAVYPVFRSIDISPQRKLRVLN